MHYEEEEPQDAAKEEVKPMPYHEQVDSFTIELDNLIVRYRNEFDLTLETMIGCLEVAKNTLSNPMMIDLGAEMLEEDENEQE